MSSCSTPWWAEYVSWRTARATDLVRRDARPDPRAADRDPAFHGSISNRAREPLREVRECRRSSEPSPQVDQLIRGSLGSDAAQQIGLERRSRVICHKPDSHQEWPGSGCRCGPRRIRPRPASGGRRRRRHRGPARGRSAGGPGRASGSGRWSPSRTTRRATSATRSAVKPSFSKIVPAGAEAPKWSIPMTAPSSPA